MKKEKTLLLLFKKFDSIRHRKTYVLLTATIFIVISVIAYYSYIAGQQLPGGFGENISKKKEVPPWLEILENKTIVYRKVIVINKSSTPGHALEFTSNGFVEHNSSFVYWPQYPGFKVTTFPVKKGDTVLVIVNGTGYDEKVLGFVMLRKGTNHVVGEAPIQPSKGLIGYGYRVVEYTGYVDLYLRGFIHTVEENVIIKIIVIVCR